MSLFVAFYSSPSLHLFALILRANQTHALATLLSGGSPRAEAVCVSRRWRMIESSSSAVAIEEEFEAMFVAFVSVSLLLLLLYLNRRAL